MVYHVHHVEYITRFDVAILQVLWCIYFHRTVVTLGIDVKGETVQFTILCTILLQRQSYGSFNLARDSEARGIKEQRGFNL